jgi:hypothetical protein
MVGATTSISLITIRTTVVTYETTTLATTANPLRATIIIAIAILATTSFTSPTKAITISASF